MDEQQAVRRAVALSRAVLGTTSPNPPVGAIVLDSSGEVVGAGATVSFAMTELSTRRQPAPGRMAANAALALALLSFALVMVAKPRMTATRLFLSTLAALVASTAGASAGDWAAVWTAERTGQ